MFLVPNLYFIVVHLHIREPFNKAVTALVPINFIDVCIREVTLIGLNAHILVILIFLNILNLSILVDWLITLKKFLNRLASRIHSLLFINDFEGTANLWLLGIICIYVVFIYFLERWSTVVYLILDILYVLPVCSNLFTLNFMLLWLLLPLTILIIW